VTLLETPRLVLRRLTEDDAPFILRLVNDPSWLENIGDRGVRTLEDAREFIRKGPLAAYARGEVGMQAVVPKDSGEPAGICGLLKRDFLEDVDLGFALLPEWRGRGIAGEAAAATVAHARAALGIRRIAAFISPGNARSGALLERIGFRREGRIPYPPDGSEVVLYRWSAEAISPAEG